MNERTCFFIKRYLSHFILERGCFLCVRGELEMGTDCYILTPSSSDHSSTSFAFWLGHWGPKALCLPLVLNWHLVPNWLQLQLELELPQTVGGTWLYNCLTPTISHHHWIQPCLQVKVISRYLRLDAPVSLFFHLFTQVHLLIDGSVKGQYVTKSLHGPKYFNIYVDIYIYIYIYIHLSFYSCTHTYIHTFTQTYIYMCVCLYMYIYIL